MNYEVVCPCGRSVRGARQRRHQVVPCPNCGRPLFVFPLSPCITPPAAPASARAFSWRGPLIAGLCSLLVVAGLFWALVPRLQRASEAPDERAGAEQLLADMEAGRRALAEGRSRRALRVLNGAVEQRERRPGLLTPEQHRRLNQLQRQADLLARLSPRSLEEVLRQAALARDAEEWQAEFADYRGKTVIFDDQVRRDEEGRPALGFYVVHVQDETARVALEDLALFERLPLEPPARLLFGARLAGCGREAGGGWVVRFAPDSGVLLTDEEAASACLPAPLDGEVRKVLERQRRWLDGLGPLPPARAE